MVLVGQIPLSINNIFQVTCTQFSVDGDRPVTVKRGALGTIGTAVGQEQVSCSMTFAIPTTGLEPDVLGALNSPDGFSITFPIGTERHLLTACFRSKRGLSTQPDSGDNAFTLNVTASEWVRVA